MKKIDRISGIVLLVFGLVVCIKCLTYPIGSFGSPGGGLFPLFASIFLVALSGLMVIQTFLKKDTGESSRVPSFSGKKALKRIFLGFMALIAFRYLFPVIGFAPSTFVFIFLMVKFLGHFNWKVSIFFSGLTALVAYYLFQVWLQIPMPQTFWRI